MKKNGVEFKSESSIPQTVEGKDQTELDYATKIAEIDSEQMIVRAEIEALEIEIAAAQLGLNTETGTINTEKLIEINISPADEIEIKLESPQTSAVEAVRQGVIADINNGKDALLAEEGQRDTRFKKVRRRVKAVLLALAVVAGFGVNTSFMPQKSAEARAHDNIQVKDLKAWEELKLYQDEINKLDNILIINEANKNSNKKYIVVDKSLGLAHLYQGDSLITSYEVGIGENVGDDQTVTVVEKKIGSDGTRTILQGGKVYWDQGNKQTGAGIYTISGKGMFEGYPSRTMKNNYNIEVPMAFHRTSSARLKYFGNKNTTDNRMSNGCLNFQAKSLEDLDRKKAFEYGTKVYVLPDNPLNRFQIVDGELRFLSNEPNVNRTTRPYEAKPIILKIENANDDEAKFLQTIADSKAELMNLYPTVSNDVYNQLAKIAYGILGQESSFGTYGIGKGQYGRVTDLVGGKILNKNVSAGVTQIRITSVNPIIKKTFNIKTTDDLFDTKKSAIATMGLLLDIYTTNIPNDQKDSYKEMVPHFYNNPKGSRKKMDEGINTKSDSIYIKKVLGYAEKVRVYNRVR